MPVKTFQMDEADRDSARKGANLIERAGGELAGGLFLKTADGKLIHVEQPAKVLAAFQTVIDFSEKGEVMIISHEMELSPEDASKILGISRPLVYQRMDAGKLPYREVGTHRRVSLDDVVRLKEAEDRRRIFTAALGADTEELEANHAQPIPGTPRR